VELVRLRHPDKISGVGRAGTRLAGLVERVLDREQVAHRLGRVLSLHRPLVAVHLLRPAKMQRGQSDDLQPLRDPFVRLRPAVVVAQAVKTVTVTALHFGWAEKVHGYKWA